MALSSPLSELQVFHRCYKVITGRAVPLGHSLEAQVRSGAKAGDVACLEVLNSASLNSSTGKINSNMYEEAHLILERFYSFHISWFGVKDFSEMMGFNAYRTENSDNIFDLTEPALALTYTVLSANKPPYDNILRGYDNYMAQREVDPIINENLGTNQLYPSRRHYLGGNAQVPPLLVKKDGARFLGRDADSTSTFDITGNHIQVGELMGIQKLPRSMVIPNYNPLTSSQIPNIGIKQLPSESALSTDNAIVPLDIVRNQGSGILGMNSFLVANWGLNPGFTMDGSVNMARRWTESWMQSLLCRELPVLRTSDVTADLVPDDLNDVADFKRSTTCLRCHSTMDPSAAAGRNLLVSSSENGRSSSVYGKTSVIMGAFQAIHNQATFTWPKQPDSDFHLKTPIGKLLYRSTSGKLVEKNLNGVASLGPALASEVDPYQCAAKRYFEFFTGIDIPLYDYGDPKNKSQFDEENTTVREMRGFIETLGSALKSHQNIRETIEQIIKSPYFKDSNFKMEVSSNE